MRLPAASNLTRNRPRRAVRNEGGPPDKCREWCFTVYKGNTDVEAWDRVTHLRAMFEAQNPAITALVAGPETCPTTGNRHLQCWIKFKNSRTWASTNALMPWASHLQQRYGEHPDDHRNGSAWRAAMYCMKGVQSDDEWKTLHEDGPNFGMNRDGEKKFLGLALGDLPKKETKKGQKCDLLTVKKLLDKGEAFEKVFQMGNHFKSCLRNRPSLKEYATYITKHYEHHLVRGLWVHGPPDLGKSFEVRKALDPLGTMEDLYYKEHNRWFDGYMRHKWILLDDVSAHPKFDFERMKNWADRYGLYAQVKNGQVVLVHKGFIVTSNYTIEEVCDGLDKKNGTPDEALRHALLRRFQQVEMDCYNTEEVRHFIEQWMARQDVSDEERAEHLAAESYFFEQVKPALRTRLKALRCPKSEFKEYLQTLYEIENSNGPDKIRKQAEFDRVAATWRAPLEEIRLPTIPELKRLPPGVPMPARFLVTNNNNDEEINADAPDGNTDVTDENEDNGTAAEVTDGDSLTLGTEPTQDDDTSRGSKRSGEQDPNSQKRARYNDNEGDDDGCDDLTIGSLNPLDDPRFWEPIGVNPDDEYDYNQDDEVDEHD